VIAIGRGRSLFASRTCHSKTELSFRLRVGAGRKSKDQAHRKTCCLCYPVFQNQEHLLSSLSRPGSESLHLKFGFGSATDKQATEGRVGRLRPCVAFVH